MCAVVRRAQNASSTMQKEKILMNHGTVADKPHGFHGGI
jgi:hypothetical protein